eukprot:6467463-Alexandrium_andersonii.AAC.1
MCIRDRHTSNRAARIQSGCAHPIGRHLSSLGAHLIVGMLVGTHPEQGMRRSAELQKAYFEKDP